MLHIQMHVCNGSVLLWEHHGLHVFIFSAVKFIFNQHQSDSRSIPWVVHCRLKLSPSSTSQSFSFRVKDGGEAEWWWWLADVLVMWPFIRERGVSASSSDIIAAASVWKSSTCQRVNVCRAYVSKVLKQRNRKPCVSASPINICVQTSSNQVWRLLISSNSQQSSRHP